MNRYFAEMQEVLERHGGVVEKYIGDAIMSVFGLPRVHEDDALRAVRAATDMQQALADLNDELWAQWGVSLTNRIGVNTGEVVAGDSRAGHRLVTGDAVNLAARLEHAAPDVQVLIGESTYRLVRSWVEVEALPPLTLKGKSEPSPAYRLLAVESGEREVLDARWTEIVGRGAEMAHLAQTLDAVVATRSSAVVAVMGEAGIFWPLVEVVGRAAGITADDAPGAAREKLRALFPADVLVTTESAASAAVATGATTTAVARAAAPRSRGTCFHQRMSPSRRAGTGRIGYVEGRTMRFVIVADPTPYVTGREQP